MQMKSQCPNRKPTRREGVKQNQKTPKKKDEHLTNGQPMNNTNVNNVYNDNKEREGERERKKE